VIGLNPPIGHVPKIRSRRANGEALSPEERAVVALVSARLRRKSA
jgi:hypothetical protein